MKKYFLYVMIVILLFTACERVIDVDLNIAAPAPVIEGRILMDTTAYVEMHETSSYFRPDSQQCVCNATVVIRKNEGPADTLKQIAPGKYRGSTIYGRAGETYILEVLYNDQVFSARSFLGPAPQIYSLTQQGFASFGDFGDTSAFNFGEELPDSLPSFLFTNIYDDPGTENYYRFEYYVNGEMRSGRYFVSDDENAVNDTLKYFPGPTALFDPGDTVTVCVYAIDKDVYDYFDMLNDALSGNGFFSSTPYNPHSNISNGALGYFSAASKACGSTVIVSAPFIPGSGGF